MTSQEEQTFLNELDKKLWTAADKLRSTNSAAEYKHAVLGLIFVKYVSDAFEKRRKELEGNLKDPAHDYYIPREDFDTEEEYLAEINTELEVRDYYTEKNVFWVPERARWNNLEDNAKILPKSPLPWLVKNSEGKDVPEEMKSVGILIDKHWRPLKRSIQNLKEY